MRKLFTGVINQMRSQDSQMFSPLLATGQNTGLRFKTVPHWLHFSDKYGQKCRSKMNLTIFDHEA